MYKLAVIGNPITHSLSPKIHKRFAKQCGLDITYEKICAPVNQFKKTVDIFRKKGGHGANITQPFKQAAFEYVDELTQRAKFAGAVNTLIFKGDHCIGDNTDGIGLLRDLDRLKLSPTNKCILILGAGGAARGIIPALQSTSPTSITIYNRTLEKSKALANAFSCDTYMHKPQSFDLLINTTNANFQETTTFNDLEKLNNTDCYDLNYGDKHNTFAQWTKNKNTKSCYDGYGMLVEQAAESFCKWTNVERLFCL